MDFILFIKIYFLGRYYGTIVVRVKIEGTRKCCLCVDQNEMKKGKGRKEKGRKEKGRKDLSVPKYVPV